MSCRLLILIIIVLCIASSAEARRRPAHHRVGSAATTQRPAVGLASWYGAYHQGLTMSDGTAFDRARPTAASRTLPLGSWVMVRNLRNGRAMQVQIRDRGPYVRGRIIDLSEAAARELGFVDNGIVLVSVLPLARNPVRSRNYH